MTDRDKDLRAQLSRLLDWDDAHVDFDAAIKGIRPALRGIAPKGHPHSPWQILEHLRLAQSDILDFCRNPAYVWPSSMDDYWPPSAAPPDAQAWRKSTAAFRRERSELKKLAADTAVDLFARIPHGTGQTYLRELLLAADHNAYHIGQLIAVCRCLGIWK